jgi:hypothetical protein
MWQQEVRHERTTSPHRQYEFDTSLFLALLDDGLSCEAVAKVLLLFTYESRSGLVALLDRLGREHHKPEAVSRKLDTAKQAGFIKGYEDLLNHLTADEAVLFADAVLPANTQVSVDRN